MAAAPTTLSTFIDTMFHILTLPTGYWNSFPYNLGYYHSNGHYTFDCVNLIKVVLNGWEPYTTPGDYTSNLSRTGDCDEWGLISQCRGVSGDFTTLHNTSVLYMSGHIGCYMGEFTRGGKIYNTIECTPSYGGGVVASYVDQNGDRWDCKNGTDYGGRWELHGLLTTWLTYDTEFVDPGDDTDPINPGGGDVNPPWWESPVLNPFNKKAKVATWLRPHRLYYH